MTGVILVLAVLGDHLGLIGDRMRRRRGRSDPAGASVDAVAGEAPALAEGTPTLRSSEPER